MKRKNNYNNFRAWPFFNTCTILTLIMNFFYNVISPLDQFEIRNLLSINAPVFGNLSLSITNIALYLTIAGYILVMISVLSTNNDKLIPNA